MRCDSEKDVTTGTASYDTSRKVVPHAGRTQCDVTNVFEVRILNAIHRCERGAPQQPHRIDVLRFGKLNHHPLLMERVTFVSEMFIEVRIAFPEAFEIVIIESGIRVVVRLVNTVASAREG